MREIVRSVLRELHRDFAKLYSDEGRPSIPPEHDARRKCEAWRRDYNEERPHSAIGNNPPIEFINRSAPHGPLLTDTSWKTASGPVQEWGAAHLRPDSISNRISLWGQRYAGSFHIWESHLESEKAERALRRRAQYCGLGIDYKLSKSLLK